MRLALAAAAIPGATFRDPVGWAAPLRERAPSVLRAPDLALR